jgi:hypothetical protein
MPSTIANTAPAKVAVPVSDARRQQPTLQRRQTTRLSARLALLMADHADLDAAISALLQAGRCDDLLITRLKKRKLQIKDEIAGIMPSSSNDDDGLRQETIPCVA